ncbi:hypothetical protein GCM10029978_101900 [Actinoallomurus acanthiterrae]
MPNTPDDPGHRPPPPRQGDPQPYQGDPQPYQGPPQPPGGQPPYGAYAPPPNQPPPPAGPWQGPPPGFDPAASHAQPGAPAPQPRSTGTGFMGALLDFNFDHMVTPRLIKVIYIAAFLLVSLTSLFLLLVGLWALQFNWGKYFGIFLVPAAPLLWLFEIVGVRITLEFAINQFKITEHLKALREREELR